LKSGAESDFFGVSSVLGLKEKCRMEEGHAEPRRTNMDPVVCVVNHLSIFEKLLLLYTMPPPPLSHFSAIDPKGPKPELKPTNLAESTPASAS
jgi:hypothetical protein